MIALLACSALPPEIPDSPGTVDEEHLPALLSLSSPDLPMAIWLTGSQIVGEDFRLCPTVSFSGSTASVSAGETCRDSAGITWTGAMSQTYSAGTFYYSFNDFGPRDGLDGGWVANGQVSVKPTTTANGVLVDSKLRLDSYDGEKIVLWVDTALALSYYDGTPYADTYIGTVGMEKWGTSAVEANRVVFAGIQSCDFAQHGSGEIALNAKNTGVFKFDHAAGAAGPPLADTGEPPPDDTGDTGDTGDDGGGGGQDTGVPTMAEVHCGDCATAFIDDEEVSSCVSPGLDVGFPFPAPFTL